MQLKVIGYLGMVSLVALFYVFLLSRANQAKINGLMVANGMPPTALAIDLGAMNAQFINQFAVALLVMTVCFIGVGLWITHRVAGPIHRLKLDLAEYLNGKKIDRIHFRKGDEFKDLLELINKIIARDKPRT
jgi:hypothetical protein